MATFHEKFQKATELPGWQKLNDEQQHQFLNTLMDEDEGLSGLDANQRVEFLHQYGQRLQQEAEKEQQVLQDTVGATFGDVLTPGGGVGSMPGVTEFVSKNLDTPILRSIPRLANTAQRATGYTLGAAQIPQDLMAQYFPGGEEFQPGPDNVNAITKFGDEMVDAADAWGRVTGAATTLGSIRNPIDAVDWIAGGFADSVGYMLPAVAAGVTTSAMGAPQLGFSAAMAATFAGEERREMMEETGGTYDPLNAALSGVAQMILTRVAGPESLVFKSTLRQGMRQAISKGGRRLAARVIAHGTLEATTEFAQEYLMQQVAEWEAGDKGWWNNLEPDEKAEIKEGAYLGMFLGALSAAPQVVVETATEEKARVLKEYLEATGNLTPEERGALGELIPVKVEKMSIEDARLRNAPDFLSEEQTALWIEDKLPLDGLTEDQIKDLNVAEEMAENDSKGRVNVKEGRAEGRTKAAIESLVLDAFDMADELEANGDAEGAARVRRAAGTVKPVLAMDAGLRSMQGLANAFGINLQFYTTEGGRDLGIRGTNYEPGVILANANADYSAIIGQIVFHEMNHSAGKVNPEAQAGMYKVLKGFDPLAVAEMEAEIKQTYRDRGIKMTDERLMSEVVSQGGERLFRSVLEGMRDKALLERWVNEPGSVKKVMRKLYETYRKLNRSSPLLQTIFGRADEKFDPSRQVQLAQMTDAFIKFLDSGRLEATPEGRVETDYKRPTPRVKGAVPNVGVAKQPTVEAEPEAEPEIEVDDLVTDRFKEDNFGRQGRKKINVQEGPAPEPRKPRIVDENTPTIELDKGKRAGKRQVTDIGEVAPPEAREPRILIDEEAELPAEVELKGKGEPVRTPRKPTILEDVPMTRTTSARLAVGDQLEVDDELVSVTGAEKLDNGKYAITYVNQDGDVSTVTTAPNKRFDRIDSDDLAPEYAPPGEAVQERLDLYDTELEAEIESDTEFSLDTFKWSSDRTKMIEQAPDKKRGEFQYESTVGMLGEWLWSGELSAKKGSYLMYEDGYAVGYFTGHLRYAGTPDEEFYVDYIKATFNKDGTIIQTEKESQNRFDIKDIMKLREYIREDYPGAVWVGGFRVSGTRSPAGDLSIDRIIEGKKDKAAYTRVPLFSNKERNAGLVPADFEERLADATPGKGNELQVNLDSEHGTNYAELMSDTSWIEIYDSLEEEQAQDMVAQLESPPITPDGDVYVEDKYDENSHIFSDEESEELDQALQGIFDANRRGLRDPDDFFSFDTGKPVSEYTSDDWNALGKKHGVKNLGGIGKMVKIAKDVEVPGGLEGTFTYEELLWLKHQSIDTATMDEKVHLALHKKIARTLQPDAKDTLQVLNNFIFSMLSPNQPLTPNELAYSVVRVRNMEESAKWAQRVPWDVTEGEIADYDSFLKYDADNEEVKAFIREQWKNTKKNKGKKTVPPIQRMNRSDFRRYYRNYYNQTIAREFGIQGRSKGGLGLLGTAEMSNIAELNQYFQKDPEWFLMGEQDGRSWTSYVERIATQFRGMGIKVAAFAAVWQDPLFAAISAIDRHMGRQFEQELFNTPQDRLTWELKVLKEWNRTKKAKKQDGKIVPDIRKGEIANFDELFLKDGGDTFFVEKLMKKLGERNLLMRKNDGTVNENLPKHWQEWNGKWLALPKDRKIAIMSDNYRNAINYNAKKAKTYGMGLFSTQWYLWDRYRRRLEPHEINFPGLYKLPHLPKEQVAAARQAHADAGYLAGTKVKTQVKYLDLKGKKRVRRDIMMKPVRTAPLGSLNYFSFDVGPTHFPPGRGIRSPMYNQHQASPLNSLATETGPLFAMPEDALWYWMRRKIQDKFFSVRQLQDVIERSYGSIHEDMDAYMHEMLYHGKAATQIERFEKNYVHPLMDYIQKNNIDIEDFEEWLHARHATERNAHLKDATLDRRVRRLTAEIEQIKNQIEYSEDQDRDTTILKRRLYRKERDLAATKQTKIPHSGMTDQQAKAILEEAGDKYDEAGRIFDEMMNRKIQIMVEGGLITEKEAQNVSIYEHYVPLKGKDYKGDLEDLLDDAGISTGRGFDIRGDDLGYSFGRFDTDRHTHPILPQAVVDIEEAIIRVEKNRVGQAFLKLVNEYQNPDLYEVSKVHKRRIWDKKTKEIRTVTDAFANREDNVISVKVDGVEHFIDIYNARLASAMKNLGSNQMGAAVKILAGVNRFLATINTTLNPEFMLANFVRDLQTAGINLSADNLKAIRGDAIRGIIPAMNAIRKAEFASDAESDAMVQLYREFEEDGGKIGFFGYNDVASKAIKLQRYVNQRGNDARHVTYRYLMKAGDLISSGNSVVENGTRLSAYIAARKAGLSRAKAATIARNLTVNFNKKGEAGQLINALWLFANASIQGTFRMGKALKSPTVQKMVGAQIMGSFAMAALARASGEDEEDGIPYWEKIGDWEKERNLIVFVPGTNGDYVKVPLPYGYNIFHVLGTELEDIVYKMSNNMMTPNAAASSAVNLFNALMGAFNPLGSVSLDTKWTALRFAVPSAFAPIADTLVNETYYGAPIHPVRSSWDYSPDSTRYFKSVNKQAKELTQYLNRWTGGSEYESGWMDLNPENLEYLVGSYAGAGAKTVLRGITDINWLRKALSGQDTSKYDANDLVFARRIYGELNENTAPAMFYENMEQLKQGQEAYENLTGKEQKVWRERNGWMVPLFDKLKEAEKGIRDTDDPDAKNRIRKRFNGQYRQAWLSQFE